MKLFDISIRNHNKCSIFTQLLMSKKEFYEKEDTGGRSTSYVLKAIL